MWQEFVQCINQVGFPIAACVAMYIMNEKQDQRHREETDKLSEALQNNTLVMQRLVDNLEK